MAQANYYEYYFFTEQESTLETDDAIFKTNIGEDKFKTVITNIAKNNNWKYFQKEYKEYHYNDIIYQNPMCNEQQDKPPEVKVHRNIIIDSTFDNNVLTLAFQRQKLSLINVPSNKNYNSIVYVKHLIFRISSRIYLNAIVKRDEANNVFYEIYMNYNHDANVDKQLIDKQINDIKTLISKY